MRRFLIMTQSYSAPMSYDLIRESDTFDEEEDVQSSEVVLLTYANDNFYLNVPHSLDKDTGEYVEKNLIFQNWQDYKDVDFNGWFMVEYDEENKKVHLKHFNTGKYMTILNEEDIDQDYATLKDERSVDSEMSFEPVNSKMTNVIHFTRDTVFKISASSENDALDKSYIRFANEEDKKRLFGGSKEKVFEESTNETVPLVVRDFCPINKYDTFNLVFPKDDTYRELVFCKDTYSHLKTFLASIEETEDELEQMSGISHGLFKTFIKIYKFLTNSLEGRINADYDIGEIVEYRQEMIAKVGILIQIFDFLKV